MHKFNVSIFIFSLCICSTTLAQPARHEGVFSQLSVGMRYSSLLRSRGVILYKDFQVDPVVVLFMFDDRLEIVPDGISYRDFVYKDMIRLRAWLYASNDDPLFPAYESVRSGWPDRDDTYEWTNRIEIFLPGYNDQFTSEIDLGWSKDLKAHHGNYFELTTKVKLFSVDSKVFKKRLEPNFVATLGYGDGAHNAYLYGPSDNISGFNNYAYGVWIAFPDDADRAFPIIQIMGFSVLGDRHRNAEYSYGRSDGFLVSLMATVGVLD